MRERSTAIYDHLALGDKLVRTRSGETNAYGNTSRVRPWSGIPRRHTIRLTMSAVSGSLATRRPRTGARCTSRAHGSLPPTAITCPVAGARAGTCRAAPRAPAHVITSWDMDTFVRCLPFFPEPRPSRVASQRREEAPRGHGDQSGSATHNNALDVHASPIGLLMPFFSPAKGIVINNAGCGTSIACRAFPSPRRSYQLFFSTSTPLSAKNKTGEVVVIITRTPSQAGN